MLTQLNLGGLSSQEEGLHLTSLRHNLHLFNLMLYFTLFRSLDCPRNTKLKID